MRRRVGIRGGRRVADFVGQNDRFRGATAEMQVARDNVKELLLLTSPTLHCYLQKAWLSKGSERESLKALPLRVHTVVFVYSYRLIGLESGSFLRGDYKITQRRGKVFSKALVERNSVMVVFFYMISIFQKYGQKHII